jgi:hypothetical protein
MFCYAIALFLSSDSLSLLLEERIRYLAKFLTIYWVKR